MQKRADALRSLPDRLLRERRGAHRRHRLPAAGRPVRRARRRAAGQGGRAAHRRRASRALPPADAGGPDRRRHGAARGARTRWRTISCGPPAVCVTLVCLVVIVFYGRFRAIPFVGIPALMGVAFAFGVAELLFGYLERVDGVHGLDRRRQRHQLPDHPAGALRRGAARAAQSPREAASIALGGDHPPDRRRRARRRGRLRVA